MDQFNFSDFPNTNFNEANLDWIVETIKQLLELVESGHYRVPTGGETGQVLGKLSDSDFDTGWIDQTGGGGITEEVKQALLQFARKVAYIDDQGQTYYQDLYNALYGVTPAELVSISAVYTQSGTVYDTDSIDSLKSDLVVTATYSDSSTAVIPAADYTLSGSLTVGTSTIIVIYQDKTATFQVTVTASGVTLVSISAVYTQSGTVYDTDTLDSLKTDLVVTATYSDSTTAVIPAADYTLSGTLTAGSSVITASYGGKTDTFTVTVTQNANPLLYNWDFTQSLTDSVGGITAVTNPTNTPIVRDNGGLHMTDQWQYVNCGAIFDFDRTYEVDVTNYDPQPTTGHMRFIMWGNEFYSGNPSTGPLIYRNGQGWSMYQSSWSSSIYGSLTDRNSLGSSFTVRITVASDGTTSMYLNGVLQGVSSVKASGTPGTTLVGFGSDASGAAGGQFYNADITAFRVYSGVIS